MENRGRRGRKETSRTEIGFYLWVPRAIHPQWVPRANGWVPVATAKSKAFFLTSHEMHSASPSSSKSENMLGFPSTTSVFFQIPQIPKPVLTFSNNSQTIPFFLPKTPFQNPQNPRKFVAFAEGGNGTNKDSNGNNNGLNGLEEDLKKDQRSIFNFGWKELLNPDPENVVAVGLTGLLTWASVQVLWQLFFISFAILLAALKYSFIAALLLFILITLL